MVSQLNSLPPDDPTVIEIIEELEFGIRAENEGGKATWLECFSTRNLLWKRTMNGMMLQFIQQLNGQNFYCESRPLRIPLDVAADLSRCSRLLRRHVLPERGHHPGPVLYPSYSWRRLRRRYRTRAIPHREHGPA